MGYYTNYSITAENYSAILCGCRAAVDSDKLENIQDEFEKMELPDYYQSSDSTFHAYGKWYEWENDMLLISLKFPDILFTVDGIGEDPVDFWKAYVVNGKIQYCRGTIVYERFDPLLMHEYSGKLPDNYSYA